MILQAVKNKTCIGCMNCVYICSRKAINIHRDCRGFDIPNIDSKKCIECGMCNQVCPQNNLLLQQQKQKAYAYVIKDKNNVFLCQSGGAVLSLAQSIIRRGGVVYGVVIDSNMIARYVRADSMMEVKKQAGSKYVQADIENVIEQLCRDLERGKLCMFSGTPCYVSAVKRMLEIKRIPMENLLAIDFLCHGVPSPGLFNTYINKLKLQYKINSFRFRDKKVNGWGGYYSTGKINKYCQIVSQNWLNIYNSDCYFRESCYHCLYTSYKRISDITVGDFWPIYKFRPELYDVTGVSMIIANSEKGMEYTSSLKDAGNLIPLPIDMTKQQPLKHPIQRGNCEIECFWEMEGFEQSAQKLLNYYSKKDIQVWCGFPMTLDWEFQHEYWAFQIKNTKIYRWLRKIYYYWK